MSRKPAPLADDQHYRQHPALGGSDIRLMVRDFDSWLFHRRLKESGQVPPWLQDDEPTPAAEFGTLVHLALLQPWLYDAQAVIMPYVSSFVTKEGRQVKNDSLAKAKEIDGQVVRAEHAWAIEHLRHNFEKLFPQPIVNPDTTEIPIITHDQATGIPIKGKLDLFRDHTLYDLKTVSDWGRRKDILVSSGYHCQLAHYDALMPSERQIIIWAESVAPYRVAVEDITLLVASLGRPARRASLDRYAGIVSPQQGKARGPF